MRHLAQRISVILASVIVIIVGFSTFLGLLFGDIAYAIPANFPLAGGREGVFQTDVFAQVFVRLAVVTIAVAIVIGVLNMMTVNIMRMLRAATITARINSLVTVASFVAALLLYAARGAATFSIGDTNVSLLEDIQVPIESALAALLFFSLVYGAFRVLRDRVTPAGILFVLTVEIVLIGALPLAGMEPITRLTDWLMSVPVNAGARGILIGIALATLVTGLRVLIGQDRTYGE